MMHVPFEAIGWLHIIHRNADLLLLVSIASLGLLPLVSIYIIETEKLEAPSKLETSELVRSFLRVLIYLAILFPYLLALLSTYVSVQLVRHQGFHETTAGDGVYRFGAKATAFWRYYNNTKVLKKEDLAQEEEEEKRDSADSTTRKWKIPSPAAADNDDKMRLIEEDCIICMHPYQVGERIVWSSNPKCIHCYHYECLQAWMMEPYDARAKRCPCCRQPFFK